MRGASTSPAFAFATLALVACSGETAPGPVVGGSTTAGACRVVPATAPHGHALFYPRRSLLIAALAP